MCGMGRPTDMERQEAVKILAERHGIARVDEVYEDGETLLSRAAGCESCLDLLRLLIAAGADVNHTDADGCTPLYRACTAFNTEGARLLVEGGADVNAAGSGGGNGAGGMCQTHTRGNGVIGDLPWRNARKKTGTKLNNTMPFMRLCV